LPLRSAGERRARSIDATAEPQRREILRLVRDREMAAGRIAANFDVKRRASPRRRSITAL